MKYLAFIFGVLLIAGSLYAWIFYGKTSGDTGSGYIAVGIVGSIIAGWGVAIHEKEMNQKNGIIEEDDEDEEG